MFSFAQVSTFTSVNAGGNWENAATWTAVGSDVDGIPDADDIVIINNTAGGAANPVTINSAAACNTLTVGNTNRNVILDISAGFSLAVGGNLAFNGTGQTQALNVNTGTVTVAGSVTYAGTAGNPVVTVTTGIITVAGAFTLSDGDWLITGGGTMTFNGLVTHTAGTIDNNTTAGTINFNAGYTSNGGTFTSMSGETINFGGNFLNSAGALTLNIASTAVFNGGTPTITPTAAITFGNFQINSGIAVTLAGSITVIGNWTNNGGTLTGGVNTVTFGDDLALRTGTIGGTSGTSFPNLIIEDRAQYTLAGALTYSCVNLTFIAAGGGGGSAENTLTHNAGNPTLNVTGAVIMNQPTGNGFTCSWNINGGAATVAGSLSFTGTNTTVTRITQVVVTSGALTVTGAVNWMAQPAGTGVVVTEVITVSTGTVTFGASLSMPDGSGTLSVTGAGTINFNGAAPSFNFFNGAAAADVDPVFTTTSGCTLNFKNGFTNSNVALTIAAGSNSVFTGGATSTITSNAAITFGNFKIDATAAAVTLAVANISVKNNWTSLGGTLSGNFAVVFNGTVTQIINITGSQTFYNLTSATTGSGLLQLASDVTVTNLLTMTSGNIDLSTYTLQLGNGGASTLTRTAGIMYNSTGGAFKRYWPAGAITSGSGNYYGLFPIGSSTVYRPVTINTTADVGGAGYLSASHTDVKGVTDVSIPGAPGTVVRITNQQAILTNSGITGGTYNLDVVFSALSTVGAYADMRLVVPVTGGLGTHVTPTGVSINNPTGERDDLTIAELANTWALGTVDITNTPLWQYYYSTGLSSAWNTGTTWSLSSTGLPNCGCVPTTADDYVVIRTLNTVSVDAPAPTVGYIDIQTGGILNGTANLTVTYDLTTFAGSGYFGPTTGAWAVGGNVLLNTGSISNVTAGGSAMSITGNLTISTGASLALAANCTVSGNVTVDGALTLGGNTITWNGSAKTISGTSGSITTSGGSSINLTNSKTINAGSNLTIGTGALPITLALAATTTVTNNGTITLGGSMTGANATSSIWIQNPNSVLNITGTLLTSGAGGVLTASVTPNTVNYNGSGAQTIKTPTPATYYNLSCSNANTKSTAADFSVTNLVTIQDAAILSVANTTDNLTGSGGLTMTGASQLTINTNGNLTFPELTGTYSLTAGTVVLNPTANNPVVRGVTYYNLTLSGSRSFNASSLSTVTSAFVYSSSGNTTLGADIAVGSWTQSAATGNLSDGGYTITVNGGPGGTGGWTKDDPSGTLSGTVVFSSSGAQTIGGTQSTTFNNLTINNTFPTTAITLAAPITVNGTLTLTDGHIVTTAANLLTMGASAALSLGATPQDSSFVKGPMAHTVNVSTSVTKIFPIGKDNDYRRVDLTIDQTPVTSTTYTAEMKNTSAAALGYTVPVTLTWVSGTRYYEITQSGATALDNAQLRSYFQCSQKDDAVEDLSDLSIAQDDGAGAWVDRGGTAGGIIDPVCGGLSYAGDILSDPITVPFILHAGANQFVLASKGGLNPLPVELLSFDAKPRDNAVDVTWSTASEFNSDYFVVQRIADPNLSGLWEDVAQVKASGYSSATKNYSAMDYDPYSGVSYYRLKQADNYGKVVFSAMVSVNLRSDNVLSVFPNPSPKGQPFNVSISDKRGKDVLVVVRDIQGKEFYSNVIVIASEKEVFAIDPSGTLASGVYFVIATSDNDIYEKIIVIK